MRITSTLARAGFPVALLAVALAALARDATDDDNGACNHEENLRCAVVGDVDVSDEVAAALDRANAAFSRAWVAGDVQAMTGSYTANAIVHPPAGGVLVGSERVRKFWDGVSRDANRVGHRIEPRLRRLLGATVILEMGRWHAATNVAGTATWQSGCYTVIWQQDENGRAWRMDYDAWTRPMDADWACQPQRANP